MLPDQGSMHEDGNERNGAKEKGKTNGGRDYQPQAVFTICISHFLLSYV